MHGGVQPEHSSSTASGGCMYSRESAKSYERHQHEGISGNPAKPGDLAAKYKEFPESDPGRHT